MSDLTDATLGDYRLEALVGSGSTGQVYRGVHVYLGSPIALRVIDPRLAASAGFRAGFLQYAQTLTAISHPNLVKVYHCGEQDGHAYVVMELVTGGSLSAARPEPAQPWSQASWTPINLVKQAAEALDLAHTRGLVHGDLKLSKLLLTQQDLASAHVKVSGLGTLSLASASGWTPKAAAAHRSLSNVLEGPAEDVFALGSVLYELITGRSILGGSEQRPLVDVSDTALIGDFPAGVPDELRFVVMRCLSRDPKGRILSCAELANALSALLSAAASRPSVEGSGELVARGPQAVTVAPPKTIHLSISSKRKTTPPKPPEPVAGDTAKIPALHVFDEGGDPVDKLFVRTAGLTLGRSASNDVALSAESVSPQHARIDWDTRRVTVTDLGSANGTLLQGQRLLPQVAQEWGREQWLQIGSFWFWLQLPGKDTGTGADKIEILFDARSKAMTLTPGKPATCHVVLVNQKTHVDHVLLEVEGIPEDWIEGIRGETQLSSFEKRELTLTINVPRSPAGLARDYNVTLRAKSTADPNLPPGVAEARWTVLPFEAMNVSIAPARSGGRMQAKYTVLLQHDGNKPATYVLTGTDEYRQLECLFSAESSVERNRLQIEVEPGTKPNVKLKVAAPARWFGSPQACAFNVIATPAEGGQPLTTEGQFTHKSIFPAWLIATSAAFIVAMVALLPPLLRPSVVELLSVPTNPVAGQPVEIRWDVRRATSLSLFRNDNNVEAPRDPDATRGSFSFPNGFQEDTRIRLRASNLFGEGAREVTVAVTPPPKVAAQVATVELTVSPLMIAPDQQVTIRWKTTNAARVELTPLGSVDPQGTTVHSPTGDPTTYTLTAYNADNVPTVRSATVRVRQPGPTPADLSFTASSPNRRTGEEGFVIGVGQVVVFQWRATNATKVRIDGLSPADLSGTSGQKVAELRGEGLYTFTLVAETPDLKEVRSEPINVQATCRSLPGRIIRFNPRCNRTPEVRWRP
jgi:serine/threonine protein kinase